MIFFLRVRLLQFRALTFSKASVMNKSDVLAHVDPEGEHLGAEGTSQCFPEFKKSSLIGLYYSLLFLI